LNETRYGHCCCGCCFGTILLLYVFMPGKIA
jgi:hypothetical protein